VWREDVASFEGEFVRFESVRVNPKPVRDRKIPIMLGGNSDSALRRVAAIGDGWYGFYLKSVADVAERVGFLEARCRDTARRRVAVCLRNPQVDDVARLSDLGVDEFVIVESPPADPRRAADWVSTLADRWLSATTSA